MTSLVLPLLVLTRLVPRASADPLAELEAAAEALYDRAAPAVVVLLTPEGLGSGVLLQANGLILTNGHVVGSHGEVDVVLLDGRKLPGKVIERAPGVDLALVDIEGDGYPTLTLGGQDTLRIGSWVATVGHGVGGAWTFATGMVTNMYPLGDGHPVFQTQVPVNPGNSGGPVLDRHGNVVGIVTAGLTDAQNVNFAIRSEVAARSLEALAPFCDCLLVRAPAGALVFLDGKLMGTGPRLTLDPTTGSHQVFAMVNGSKIERTVAYPQVREVDLSRP